MLRSKKFKFTALILSCIVAGTSFAGCGHKEEKPVLNFMNYGENIGEAALSILNLFSFETIYILTFLFLIHMI